MPPLDPDRTLELARSRIAAEAEGVLTVAGQLGPEFVRVVELALGLSGKIFVTGSGTSGIIARRMAHLLTVCGTPALYIQPMDALHGAMGAVQRGDMLIAISRGGASSEINELARRLRQLDVPVVSITSAPGSDLAQLADVSIVIVNAEGADPGRIVAMGSTLAVGAWGDALAHALMVLRAHSWAQVLHNHPAGAVGQLTSLPPDPTSDSP